MRQSLQETLFNKYPALFRQRHLPLTESALGRGIECADGWFPILDGLCETLTTCGRDIGHGSVEIIQVKQKFGALRVYLTESCAWCHGAVQLAGAFSQHICEETGRSGISMERSRWVRTLAEDVGQAIGYKPLVGHGNDTLESDLGGYGELPASWRALARVLGALVSDDTPTGSLHFRCEDGRLNIDSTATDQRLAGAIFCAYAIAERLSPMTGAMHIPPLMSADDTDVLHRV